MSKTMRDIVSTSIPTTTKFFCFALVLFLFFSSESTAKIITTSRISNTLRPVRVLIGSRVRQFKMRSVDSLLLENTAGDVLSHTAPHQWVRIRWVKDKIVVAGQAIHTQDVMFRSSQSAPMELSMYKDSQWTRAVLYPGAMQYFHSSTGQTHLVNHVDVEAYVAGVVAREVWPTFATEAYRAQAIVARSFVLSQMQHRQSKAWDVSDGQSSQVYAGLREDRTGIRATEAAIFTAGIVCVYDEDTAPKIIRTYYSAACGGMTQSAAIFGPENDIAPLAGGVACDYCRIAPGNSYRWEPVHLSIQEIFRRVIARHTSFRSLGTLQHLSIVKRSAQGRPTSIRLHGQDNQYQDMLVERFRLCIGGDVIRSSDFSLRIDGNTVTFENGRGYGHGLGLCQWGMEGQARAGKHAADILRYYFPTSRLQRAY